MQLNNKKKKIIIISTIFIVLIGIMLLLGFFVSSKAQALKEQETNTSQIKKALTNVITMEIVPSPVQEVINLPGRAKPWKSLTIVAEVQGKIIKKEIIEGTQVKIGDILAVIDKRDYENSYDSAVASFETAMSSKKRLEALKKKKFITQSELDDVTAKVKQAKALRDNAKLNLERCTILSPMDGIVDKIFIENGTFLSSGDPVMNILQIDKVKIEVGIPESDVDVVKEIDDFDITIDALENRQFKGKRYYLYNTTDSFARLYNLEISVENYDKKILPDMFARVKIIKHYIEDGLSVPMYALVNKNGVDGVYVVENNVANFRKVEKGFLDKWRIQIAKGLEPNDKVVVMGQRLISDKEQVNITKNIKSMEELSQ
ncbi:MAG: efflux RND transporter periplasmic adaptor subunit [Desulfobacterales bacterium]|nr:efflux RND transporter periplasmic adaptor subunit [Desulfobacterales bacterium]